MQLIVVSTLLDKLNPCRGRPLEQISNFLRLYSVYYRRDYYYITHPKLPLIDEREEMYSSTSKWGLYKWGMGF